MKGTVLSSSIAPLLLAASLAACGEAPSDATASGVETTRQPITLSAPDQLQAELLPNRNIRFSWRNTERYHAVYISWSSDPSQSMACVPRDGFFDNGGLYYPPGTTRTCEVPSPTGDETADTNFSFDVQGCNVVNGGCSPTHNPLLVFLRRPAAPGNLSAVLHPGGDVHFSWNNNETFFMVHDVISRTPNGRSSRSAAPRS